MRKRTPAGTPSLCWHKPAHSRDYPVPKMDGDGPEWSHCHFYSLGKIGKRSLPPALNKLRAES